MKKSKPVEYKCRYCGEKMHKIDFEMHNGFCGKCREILDWKSVLGHMKEYKK